MRHRWMYYMTGLPGWMRFGFSPGWVGRSPTGLGPCASYLLTGQWPTPQMAAAWPMIQAGQWPTWGWGAGFGPWGAVAPGGAVPFGAGAAVAGAGGNLEALRAQAAAIEQALEAIRRQIEQMEKKESE